MVFEIPKDECFYSRNAANGMLLPYGAPPETHNSLRLKKTTKSNEKFG